MLTNVLNPELSSLAADAAVELDLLLMGEKTDLGSVQALSQYLNDTASHSVSDPSQMRLSVDTATETVLGRAFTETGDDHSTILGNLLNRTKEVAAELSSAGKDPDPTSLEFGRAFCLALSQSASAYRQLLVSARPPHPYRR